MTGMPPKLVVVLFAIPDAGVDTLSAIMEVSDIVEIPLLVVPGPRNQLNDPLIALARESNIPWRQVNKFPDSDLLTALEKIKPDCCIVAGFDFLIPAEFLRLPPLGFINIHPSLLPLNRGGNPYFWPIARGEEFSGVTIHRMSETFDTGPIYCQEKIPLDARECLGSLLVKCNIVTRRLIKDFLAQLFIHRENLSCSPQDDNKATYAPRVKPHHLQLDPQRSAEELERFVRAGSPYYGMTGYFRGRLTLKLWETNLRESSGHTPGSIFLSDSGSLCLECSSGSLELSVIQIENVFLGSGKRALQLGFLSETDTISPEQSSS